MRHLLSRWLLVTAAVLAFSLVAIYAGGLIFRPDNEDKPWPQTNPKIYGKVVGRTHSSDGLYLLKVHLSDDSGDLTVAVTWRAYKDCRRGRTWPNCAL